MRLIQTIPVIFMIALSGMIILGTADLRYWDNTTPGTRFFPAWLAGAGLLLALLLLMSLRRGTDPGTLDFPDAPGWRRVGLTIVGLSALGFLTPLIGMVPMIALFMLVMLTVVLGQRLVPSLVATAVVAIGVEVIFVRWLSVPLPAPFGL